MKKAALGFLLLWFPALGARAAVRPYVTLQDDGTIQSFSLPSSGAISKAFMKIYDASGAPRPQVISVWTGFDVGGESYGTFFLPQANPIQGIGFDKIFGGNGTVPGAYGPVNAILIHNSMLKLQQRVTQNRATSDAASYAQYLFLLEFSHQWLGAARVPGSNPNDLGTWPHWSFWLNSGDSPPGGNVWNDNGDGTFSTVPVNPAEVKYSNLDLYLMGLVDAGAVGPIEVLENAVAPKTPNDPSYGTPFATHSLTDFDPTPLTVTATSKSYSIGDIISTNGSRKPATSPNDIQVGFVLLVPQDAGAAEIAADQAAFDPISATLAPAFARATGGIATLTVITDGGELPEDGGIDGGEVEDAGPVLLDAGVPDAGSSPASKGGCSTGFGASSWWIIVSMAVLLARGRRKGSGRRTAAHPL